MKMICDFLLRYGVLVEEREISGEGHLRSQAKGKSQHGRKNLHSSINYDSPTEIEKTALVIA